MASSSRLYSVRKCASRYEYEKQKFGFAEKRALLARCGEVYYAERESGFVFWDCVLG
jgi:hypothetical protein